MKTNIKFSVIVPAYKVEKYLPKCIDSLVGQSYPELEIILIDDGSPDGCLKIMNQYAKQDPRICVISQSNGGLSVARNAGIKLATGDYIAFVDSDDWVEPDMFECLAHHLFAQQPDFTCFRIQYDNEALHTSYVYGHPSFVDEIRSTEQILLDTLLVENILTSACSKVYNRRFLVESGLRFEPGILNEDTLFSFQAACHARKVTFVNRVFYHALEREGSITRSSFEVRFRDMNTVFDKGRAYLATHGMLDNIEHLYEARYLRSMLYILLQATRYLSFSNYKNAVKVLCQETRYKTVNLLKNSKCLPLIYRTLLLLSRNNLLFYTTVKTANILGRKVH